MTLQELNRDQRNFAHNLDVLFSAMATSLRVNGVPSETISKAFLAGNAAVQIQAQKESPSEEGRMFC